MITAIPNAIYRNTDENPSVKPVIKPGSAISFMNFDETYPVLPSNLIVVQLSFSLIPCIVSPLKTFPIIFELADGLSLTFRAVGSTVNLLSVESLLAKAFNVIANKVIVIISLIVLLLYIAGNI